MPLQHQTAEEEQTLKYLEFKGTLSIKIGETLLQLRKQCRSIEHFYRYAKEELDLERDFVDRAIHASVIAFLIDKYLSNEEFREGAFPLVLTEHQTRNIPQFLVDHKRALDPSIESLEQSIVNIEDDDGKEAILRIWKEAVRLANGPPTAQVVERATQKILSKFYPKIHRKYKEHQAAKLHLEEEEQERFHEEYKKKKAAYYQYLRNAGKKVPEELEEEQFTSSASSKRPREDNEVQSPSPKRKRGRPPKNANRSPASSTPKSSQKITSPKNITKNSKEPIKIVHGTVLTRKQQQLQGVVTRTTARELGLEAWDLIPKTIRRSRSLITPPSTPKRPVGRPRSQPNPKTKPIIEGAERRTPTSEPPKRKRGRPPKKKSLRAAEEREVVKDLPYHRTPDSHSRHSSSRSTEEEDSYLEPSQQYDMELEDPRTNSPLSARKSRSQKDDLKAMAAHISQLQKKLKEMERTNRSLQNQIIDSEEQLSSMRHLMDRITASNISTNDN